MECRTNNPMTTSIYDVFDETFFDSDEFRAYVTLIGSLMPTDKTAERFDDGRIKGITLGHLNRLLGDRAVHSWTLDALFWLNHLIIDGVPERYYVLDRPVDPLPDVPNSQLFASNKREIMFGDRVSTKKNWSIK